MLSRFNVQHIRLPLIAADCTSDTTHLFIFGRTEVVVLVLLPIMTTPSIMIAFIFVHGSMELPNAAGVPLSSLWFLPGLHPPRLLQTLVLVYGRIHPICSIYLEPCGLIRMKLKASK